MKKKIISMLIAAACLAMSTINITCIASAEGNEVAPSFKMGDINSDGKFTISDVVIFQRWLLSASSNAISNWQAADYYKDGKLDVFDLCLMKKALLKETITSLAFPSIKVYTSEPGIEAECAELNLNEIVEVKTNYNPLMSDWSGIGIMFEFDSKDYPITLSAEKGNFLTWDIEKGNGPINAVGKTYEIGNEGYIFWAPEKIGDLDVVGSEIMVTASDNGNCFNIGKIVITKNDANSLSAVLHEVTSVVEPVIKNNEEIKTTAKAPQIKIHSTNGDSQYTEMKKNEVVEIKTDYNPLMSDWSGIGILFEFGYQNAPIVLSTDKGSFLTWDIEAGSGIIESVGKTYNVGNEGYIFWAPEQLGYPEGFENVINVEEIIDGNNVKIAEIIISQNADHTFSAVLK